MRWSRVGELLLMPLTERFVIGYTLLGFIGLPLFIAGTLTGVGWLVRAGAALCVPFILCTSVVVVVVLPVLLIANWRGAAGRDRPDD
jgi:hypothetical protein